MRLMSAGRMIFAAFALGAAAPAFAEPPVAGAGFAAAPIAGCGGDLQLLNQVSGWQASWPGEWSTIAAAPGDAAAQKAALDRWGAAAGVLRADVAQLKKNAGSKQAAPRAVASRVAQQAGDLLTRLEAGDAAFFPAAPDDFAAKWREIFRSGIIPAIRDYRDALAGDYLAAAPEKSLLAGLDDGGACFRQAILWWTTLPLDEDTVEKTGERMLDEARAALLAVSTKDRSIDSAVKRLRKTPQKAAITEEGLIALSGAAIERASAAVPAWFMATPSVSIDVIAMAPHLQPSAPAGYYAPGAGKDGASAYFINPSRPAERRLMAEVIAFHEGVPGHHLFFAYPRDGAGGAFNAGLAEGWAIYAEILADEMGLYSTNLDREGMRAKHLWAASRLIIEPRLHDGRWTRADAVAFMRKATTLPEAEIEIEIDRYLAMPGQSLTYMLGADEILSARERARAALGDDFDIREFHDVILKPGMRSLPQLRADVDQWIAEKQRQ